MPHVVATAVEHNLPAVWVLQNNYAIGTIRDLQRVYHDGREIGTSFVNERPGQLSNPDFAKMAEAMGGCGIRIEHPDQFGDAYREAIRSNVPTVLDVIINRDTSQRSSRLSASARFAESTVMTPERTFTPVVSVASARYRRPASGLARALCPVRFAI